MKTVIYGSSIKGNGHFFSGTECQDNNSFDENDFCDDEIKVTALSDGHGGAPYCRSSKGSQFAVNIAKQELYGFVSGIKEYLDEIDSAQKIIDDFSNNFSDIPDESSEALNNLFDVSPLKAQIEALENSIRIEFESIKERIVKSWNNAVDNDFQSAPIEVIDAKVLTFSSIFQEPKLETYRGYAGVTENNIDLINNDLPSNIIDSLEKNYRQLYGATLLAIAQYREHIFIFQLGDGDVTIVDNENNVDYPIKKGSHMVGNETDSLCQRDAINRFNFLYFRKKVKIAMISTDGIVNALENEGELKTIAQGIYDSINEEPDKFRASFKPFLRFFSNASMDDCTICFIANGINDEAYELIQSSVEVEEEHNLDSNYKPMLENYALNRDLFSFAQMEQNDEQVACAVEFSNVGMTAIKESFMREQYIDLAESKRELLLLESQRTLMFNIISYGKRYLNDMEQRLNNSQKDAYCNKINSILEINPLKLMVFKVVTFEMDEDLSLKKNISDERYSIVLGANDDRLLIQDVTPNVFDSIKNNFRELVTFSDLLPINETYYLNINQYDITLTKEK